jgi:dTDP-4-dehydrorhamnose reductase
MLGSDLVSKFLCHTDYQVYGLGRRPSPQLQDDRNLLADLTSDIDPHKINIVPDVVIHTASLTDLNYCEHNPEIAYKVHENASGQLARMGNRNTLFIYISTDSVFDGKTGMYKETDSPGPLNVYSESKLKGEYAVLDNNPGKTMIVRTNIYGFHSPLGRSLAEWAHREWVAGNVISGYSDIIFNAVMTAQLCDILLQMSQESVHPPIINIGSSHAVSKFDFLDQFREMLGVSKGQLRKTESVTLPGQPRRPKNTSLNTRLLSDFCKVPDFSAGLSRWIVNFNAKKAHSG